MTHPYGQNIRTPDGKWPPNAQTCSADAVAEEFKRPPVWRDEMEAELAEKALVEQAAWSDKMKADIEEISGGLPTTFSVAPTVPAVSLTMIESDGTSGSLALEEHVAVKMRELHRLFCERQRKYGPGNIAAFGDLGVCVRAQDKLARLRHHYFGGGAGDMPDESVDDAWRDLAVYAVIALVCREGGWPGLAVTERSGVKTPTEGKAS